MTGIALEALPFKEAIQSFRDKGYAISFDHRDMEREEHAYNFTVAKAINRDVLTDIRSAVDSAIAEGRTLDDFRKELTPKLQQKGWWGTQEMIDPLTGETKLVRTGSSSRLKTVFETNLRTSYAAGRWEQVQRTKTVFPYLRYIHGPSKVPRPEHLSWHNMVLPVDDPWWLTHYPPNGWGCSCTVQQLGAEDAARLGLKIFTEPPVVQERTVINKRTGEVQRVPRGIDPGFNYNVGVARARSLTPPPLDARLSVPYAGSPAAVPMPKPKIALPSSLLPDDLSEEQYVGAFLKEFDAIVGKPKVFTDVTSEPMMISDDLFRDRQGNLKITKRLRHRYLPLLARTIKQPDEVWHIWHKNTDGSSSLVRRYISRYAVEGEAVPGLAIFESSKEGWTGVTSFQADTEKYIEGQRRGVMVYRRPDEKE